MVPGSGGAVLGLLSGRAWVVCRGRVISGARQSIELRAGYRAGQERGDGAALAFFAHVDERREEWAVLFAELAARGGPFFQEVAAVRRSITDQTAQLFEIVLRRAGVSPDDVGGTEALACAFVGAGESLANWWLEHPEETKEAMANRLMDFAWGGLKHLLGPALGTGRENSTALTPVVRSSTE